ncbi:DUF4956 domain-containing protein [Candidatus Pelagibacter sp.]|nr:DUF4956 domain-containing protein [Candidatus Pelagibacter sp.]
MEDFYSVLTMLISGYLIRFSLIYSGQLWAKTFSQTVAFFILPIITYTITKTIYGNIALSLGMIGALSIVRFRHPVKSALELIIYFDLITIGIASSVKNSYAISLSLMTVAILICLKLINRNRNNSKKDNFYNISFNEGVDLNQIEVSSSEKIELIENNNNLKSLIQNSETSDYLYRLAFQDKETLNEFKNEIENLKSIKKIDVNYI